MPSSTGILMSIDVVFPGVRYGLGIMWAPNSCGGSWSHGGDIQGSKTRNGVTDDGKRSIVVTINTDSMLPEGTDTPPPRRHRRQLGCGRQACQPR